jgi:hypothetical protein
MLARVSAITDATSKLLATCICLLDQQLIEDIYLGRHTHDFADHARACVALLSYCLTRDVAI